jgi:hypothetical protein
MNLKTLVMIVMVLGPMTANADPGTGRIPDVSPMADELTCLNGLSNPAFTDDMRYGIGVRDDKTVVVVQDQRFNKDGLYIYTNDGHVYFEELSHSPAVVELKMPDGKSWFVEMTGEKNGVRKVSTAADKPAGVVITVQNSWRTDDSINELQVNVINRMKYVNDHIIGHLTAIEKSEGLSAAIKVRDAAKPVIEFCSKIASMTSVAFAKYALNKLNAWSSSEEPLVTRDHEASPVDTRPTSYDRAPFYGPKF